ncbi:MAG TPA: hypothetical protein VG935_00650, partial [Patescibacteria group bacterium]|nr:hypothetical protein [Patescibacteria group bacterium]
MKKDGELADLSDWLGKTGQVRQNLATIPQGFVPDTSFRDWPDEVERSSDEVMPDVSLAYSHSFLRNDFNVLVLLALGELGKAHPYEIVNFLREQDLGQRTTVDRIQVAPVLRELANCIYAGVYKESEDSWSRYEYVPSFEGLMSMAGHLYDFSKEHRQPLSSFLGQARGQVVRSDSTIFAGNNVSNIMDRVHIVRYLQERWKDSNNTFNFATDLREMEDAIGIRSSILTPQLLDLSRSNFFCFQTTSPNDGPHQEYRWNRNGKKRKQWGEAHGAFAHYLHEYVMLTHHGLSREGAREYLLTQFPDEFVGMDSEKLDRRIEQGMNG